MIPSTSSITWCSPSPRSRSWRSRSSAASCGPACSRCFTRTTSGRHGRDLAQPGVRPDEFGQAPELGFWRLSVMRFLHHRVATGALIILGVIVLSAIIVPIITGDLYRIQDYRHPFKPPFQSFQHVLGTDDFGRDEFARLLRGARLSIMVGVLAVVGYLLIG